jgi:hypothetical protein
MKAFSPNTFRWCDPETLSEYKSGPGLKGAKWCTNKKQKKVPIQKSDHSFLTTEGFFYRKNL